MTNQKHKERVMTNQKSEEPVVSRLVEVSQHPTIRSPAREICPVNKAEWLVKADLH